MTEKEIKETAIIFHNWLMQDEQVDFQKDGATIEETFDIFWEEYNSD